jgi:hypothetical protein
MVDVTGFDCAFIVVVCGEGVGRRATGRCERDCTLIVVVVVVFVADNGAVLGRTLLVELVGFPFNVDGDDGLVTDGFT